MGRPSQSGPNHVRPFWAKDDSTYKKYIENPPSDSRKPGEDFGLDNYSFDPGFRQEWQMPLGAGKSIPKELNDAISDFVIAGAAVSTGLERLSKTHHEEDARSNPEMTHKHVLARRCSSQDSAIVGAEDVSGSSTAPSSPAIPEPRITFPQAPLVHPVTQRPLNTFGMESPPYTPIDTKGNNTPALQIGGKQTVPDFQRVNAQLSPLSSPVSFATSSLEKPIENAQARETYLRAFNAEVYDLKRRALARLLASGRTVDKLFIELLHDKGWAAGNAAAREQFAALKGFAKWWQIMKLKVREYEEHIRDLEPKYLVDPEDSKNLPMFGMSVVGIGLGVAESNGGNGRNNTRVKDAQANQRNPEKFRWNTDWKQERWV